MRDWVLRLNAHGPDGALNRKAPGAASRMQAGDSPARSGRASSRTGRSRAADGGVRWRIVDQRPSLHASDSRRHEAVSDGGGERWSIVCSLIESARLNAVDPQAYMSDAHEKIVDGHLASELDALLHWSCASHPVLKDVA